MHLTAVLAPVQEGGLVAMNPETGFTSQGETFEEAIANLKDATVPYLEEVAHQVTGHPLITRFLLSESVHA